MGSFLKAITMNTDHMEDMVAFFSCLGVNLQPEKINKGSQVFRGKVGDLVVSLISIPRGAKLPIPDVSISLHIEHIDAVVEKLKKHPKVQFVMDLQDVANGKMAIVTDPDGRSVEISN